MKILQAGSSLFNSGGIERYIIHLADGLTARGHEVHITAPSGSWLFKTAEEHHHKAFALKVYNQHDLHTLGAYRRLIRRERYDIINTHFSRDYLVPGLASRLEHRRGMVIHRHMPHCWPHIRRWMYSKALYDKVVGVSHAVYNALLEGGIPPERLEMVYGGVEKVTPGPAPDIRGELGIVPDTVLIGIVSRVIAQKGHRELVQSMKYVDKRAVCVVVGDGNDLATVKRITAQEGLQDRVFFLGWRNDSDAITSALDIVVQPSLWEEACSQAILEAMSMAKPLVVTRSGGNAELVQHGLNGYVVPKFDLQAMADALNLLTSDANLRHTMGVEGLKRQQEQFTVETMAQGMERVYHSIVTAQGALSQRMAS